MNRKCDLVDVSTHSRPKAAGQSRFEHGYHLFVSTHSRPKAAGYSGLGASRHHRRFNTQPPEGGWALAIFSLAVSQAFQHTAARRRLEPLSKALLHQVSQPRFR